MIEKVIILDSVDLVVFYGVNNSNLQLLKSLFPKIRLAARGSVIRVIGDEEDTNAFEQTIRKLEAYCLEFNVLDENIIISFVKGAEPSEVKLDNLIIHGVSGKSITARTPNQKKLVDAFDKNDMVFALGPAGSGKTYVAIALAVRALKNKQVKKIILSRPAVEAVSVGEAPNNDSYNRRANKTGQLRIVPDDRVPSLQISLVDQRRHNAGLSRDREASNKSKQQAKCVNHPDPDHSSKDDRCHESGQERRVIFAISMTRRGDKRLVIAPPKRMNAARGILSSARTVPSANGSWVNCSTSQGVAVSANWSPGIVTRPVMAIIATMMRL